MNKITLILLLVIGYCAASTAQQIGLQAGQSFSNFQFKDSNGNELDNLNSVNKFCVISEYHKTIFTEQTNEQLWLNIGLRFSGYGAVGSDPQLDNSFEWDVSYMGLLIGLDYDIYDFGRVTAFASTKISSEFLLRGTQVINGQSFSLVGQEDFNTPLTFFRGGLGTKFELTSNASIFIQYMIGKSFSFFDSSASQLNIIDQNFGIGLYADLYTGQKKRRRP